MSRLKERFATLKSEGGKALIPYITAGRSESRHHPQADACTGGVGSRCH